MQDAVLAALAEVALPEKLIDPAADGFFRFAVEQAERAELVMPGLGDAGDRLFGTR